MPRCPICQSPDIRVKLAEVSSASCGACGASWLMDGERRFRVRPGPGGPPADEDLFVTDWALPPLRPLRERRRPPSAAPVSRRAS